MGTRRLSNVMERQSSSSSEAAGRGGDDGIDGAHESENIPREKTAQVEIGALDRIASARLRELREQQGLTLVDLAERIKERGGKFYAGRLSELENLKRAWKLHTLQVISAGLGVSPLEMLSESSDMDGVDLMRAYAEGGITAVMRWTAEALERERGGR